MKYTCSMETVQQNGRFTLFSSKFLSIHSILYVSKCLSIYLYLYCCIAIKYMCVLYSCIEGRKRLVLTVHSRSTVKWSHCCLRAEHFIRLLGMLCSSTSCVLPYRKINHSLCPFSKSKFSLYELYKVWPRQTCCTG